MIKIKKRKILLGFCTALFSVAMAGHAWAGALIRETEFVSQSETFQYQDVEQNIYQDGREYTLHGIEYELLEELPLMDTEEKTAQKELTKNGRKKKDDGLFPESVPYDEDGFEGELYLKSVRWNENKKIGKTVTETRQVDYGYQTETPKAVPEIIDSIKGQSISLKLVEVKQVGQWRWVGGHTASVTLSAVSGFKVDAPAPSWIGRQKEIFQLLGLNQESYEISDAEWVGEELGGETRKAKFTLDRYVASFKAIYQGERKESDIIMYDGIAVYEGKVSKTIEAGKEYRVKAIMEYKAPEPTPAASSTPSATMPSSEISATTPPDEKGSAMNESQDEKISIVAALIVLLLGVGGGIIAWYFLFRKTKR